MIDNDGIIMLKYCVYSSYLETRLPSSLKGQCLEDYEDLILYTRHYVYQ